MDAPGRQQPHLISPCHNECMSVPRRCRAHNRAGKPCSRRPVPGADVCPSHGGKAPQVARRAAERVAMDEALAILARDGVTPVDNPLAALAELAGEVLAVKNIFRDRLAALDEADWRRTGQDGGEQLRAEVAMYERALDRAARVLADIGRLKIDERLQAITEHQAQTLVTVFTAVLERLDLGEQAAAVRELVADEMERLGEREAAA